MSKDKGSKNIKKAPAEGGKKSTSDYQAGKKARLKMMYPSTRKNNRNSNTADLPKLGIEYPAGNIC